jgi:hypothetical protein
VLLAGTLIKVPDISGGTVANLTTSAKYEPSAGLGLLYEPVRVERTEPERSRKLRFAHPGIA